MISNRLSDILSDKEHFDKAALIYIEALKNSSFQEILKPTIPARLCRGRKIVWLNLPFSSNVRKCRKTIFNPFREPFLAVS